MEKIKISDFVERFEALKTDEEKSEMMKSIIVNTYVPFNTKYIYSKLLADKCCYEHVTKTGEDGKPFNEKTGKIKKDSGLQYHLFWRSVIDLYTNLERTDSFVDDYDNLVRTGILPAIVSAIPKGEFDEFNRLCDYAVADLLYNTNSPETGFTTDKINQDKKLCESKGFIYIETKKIANKINIGFICKNHKNAGVQYMRRGNMNRDNITGCKYCLDNKKYKFSKGEQRIENFLQDNSYEYIKE